MPRNATALKKPTLTSNYTALGKRDSKDRDMIIALLEGDPKMPQERRERFAVMMFLDWEKMNADQQNRFAAVMERGSPDERRRIGCLVEKANK